MTPRSKGEATREAVLEAALAHVSLQGYEGLSLGPLAKRVGLSKSGLYAHFESKEDLQLATLTRAVEHFVADVVRPALSSPRGEPRLRALFERWLAWPESDYLPGGCPFLPAAGELDDRPGPLRDALVASQKDWLATLAKAAELAISEGHFRADLDSRTFATQVYSLAISHAFFARLLRDPESLGRTHAAFEDLLARSR